MSSLNEVTLVGNVGKDPEVRAFSNGGRVCNLTVATSERWKDKQSGEQKERTEWHNVVIRSEHTVGVAERFVRKGAKILVKGAIQSRKYQDQSGVDRYITEIVVGPFRGELILLDKPAAGSGSGSVAASAVTEDQIPF